MDASSNDGTRGSKLAVLDARLRSLGRVVVAYSGGVDSTFLAAAAHRALGDAALAVTAISPSMAVRERSGAEATARRFGWNHVSVRTHEVERERYAVNAPDRCYWCKTELFEVLAPIAAQRAATIAVGTNLDDLSDYRPGARAVGEHGVATPLSDAGLTKADVRALSVDMGLPTYDKPASPCLASRFAYGVRVTAEGLRRIDRAEEVLRGLGFGELRVRDHGDLARIEVPPERLGAALELRETIAHELKSLGFRYVTLDLLGFRSGAMNEVLFDPTIVRRPGP